MIFYNFLKKIFSSHPYLSLLFFVTTAVLSLVIPYALFKKSAGWIQIAFYLSFSGGIRLLHLKHAKWSYETSKIGALVLYEPKEPVETLRKHAVRDAILLFLACIIMLVIYSLIELYVISFVGFAILLGAVALWFLIEVLYYFLS